MRGCRDSLRLRSRVGFAVGCDVCAAATSQTSPDRDRILAEDIVKPEKKDLRKCFATLALAGCLFAFRSWDLCSTQGELRPFLEQLVHPDEYEMRHMLFEPFIRTGRSEQSVDGLAQQLVGTLRQTWAIFNIPRFGKDTGGKAKRFRDVCNLPFTHIMLRGSPGMRPGKIFRAVEFDPDYCDSEELKVWFPFCAYSSSC